MAQASRSALSRPRIVDTSPFIVGSALGPLTTTVRTSDHSRSAPRRGRKTLAPETSATTTHAMEFTSVVERGRVAGVQFHPEKSGTTGLRLLANFVALARET